LKSTTGKDGKARPRKTKSKTYRYEDDTPEGEQAGVARCDPGGTNAGA